jgi:hypothetical protein
MDRLPCCDRAAPIDRLFAMDHHEPVLNVRCVLFVCLNGSLFGPWRPRWLGSHAADTCPYRCMKTRLAAMAAQQRSREQAAAAALGERVAAMATLAMFLGYLAFGHAASADGAKLP